jgi:transcriptional regulator with XRE-family HTH domain
MIVDSDIAFNMIQDFRKKDISPVKRAELIESYREHMGLSQRALARELEIPHSTLQDWISYSKIGECEYNQLRAKGVSREEVYHVLRDKRKQTKSRLKGLLEMNEAEIVLKSVVYKIESILPVKDITPEMRKSIERLKRLINEMER